MVLITEPEEHSRVLIFEAYTLAHLTFAVDIDESQHHLHLIIDEVDSSEFESTPSTSIQD